MLLYLFLRQAKLFIKRILIVKMIRFQMKNVINLSIFILIIILITICFKSNLQIKRIEYKCNKIKKELWTLSKLMTNSMRKIGQMSCNFSTNQVSENGGWCSQISGSNSSQHYFDASLAEEIGRFLTGNFFFIFNSFELKDSLKIKD